MKTLANRPDPAVEVLLRALKPRHCKVGLTVTVRPGETLTVHTDPTTGAASIYAMTPKTKTWRLIAKQTIRAPKAVHESGDNVA